MRLPCHAGSTRRQSGVLRREGSVESLLTRGSIPNGALGIGLCDCKSRTQASFMSDCLAERAPVVSTVETVVLTP